MDILEDLKMLERELSLEGLEIDHYEIREKKDDYALGKGVHDRPAYRAVGVEPLEALEDWDAETDEYVIEVFLAGKRSMDRVVYDPEIGEPEYIDFSSAGKTDTVKVLEE